MILYRIQRGFCIETLVGIAEPTYAKVGGKIYPERCEMNWGLVVVPSTSAETISQTHSRPSRSSPLASSPSLQASMQLPLRRYLPLVHREHTVPLKV